MNQEENVSKNQEVIEVLSSDEDVGNYRCRNVEIEESDDDSEIEFVGIKSLPATNGYSGNTCNNKRQRLSYMNPLRSLQPQPARPNLLNIPQYEDNMAPGFISTWMHLVPPQYDNSIGDPFSDGDGKYQRHYKLSLLSLTEFTVSLVADRWTWDRNSRLSKLRAPLKKIVQRHGNGARASFEIIPEKDNPDGGRWRIPLSCYYPFHSYLSSDQNNNVQGIPEDQLKIVSVGRELKDMGYPSVQELVHYGVPHQLASSLAPYQRGGVGFTYQRNGRSLIADEMGLGKTIQGIASMACYSSEWPLLVLCPSGARYHWQHEILHWLGADSPLYNDTHHQNKVAKLKEFADLDDDPDTQTNTNTTSTQQPKTYDDEEEKKETNEKDKPPNSPTMSLLQKTEVHVLSHSKANILPKGVRVVIASYGLGTNMIQNKRLVTGIFDCIIVDESHMLKNKNSKRTKSLLPILHDATRVVMLSGTPAFAKPVELYPQLSVLGSEQGWWNDENDFIAKYAKSLSRFSDNAHSNQNDEDDEEDDDSNDGFGNDEFKLRGNNHFAELHTLLTSTVMIRRMKVDILKSLPAKIRECLKLKVQDSSLQEKIFYLMKQLRDGKGILGKLSRKHKKELENGLSFKPDMETASAYMPLPKKSDKNGVAEKESRKQILNTLFSLTADSKVPIIVSMLKEWLHDETRGKLCIFAHHLSILDGIIEKAGLSNKPKSKSKYIRIDGSTTPSSRHEQILSFQKDPTVRVAILGITAAGVAVTLTAAATVWFSELFWTPGVLIQAEDRCHRIGQQAAVKILYFIAKGTLDELLWKLVEKKFSDLGEFVEGKDNQRIVVHNVYDGVEDYKRQNDSQIEEVRKEFENSIASDDDDLLISDLADEMSIQNFIDELGKEDLDICTGHARDQKKNMGEADSGTNETAIQGSNQGKSETGAIYLSDNDDEDDDDDAPIVEEMPHFSMFFTIMKEKRQFHRSIFPSSMQMPKLRFYSMFFQGEKYGINLFPFQKRVLVHSISETRAKNSKPSIGDILVSINSTPVRWNQNFEDVTRSLKEALRKPPVLLLFCENEDVTFLVHLYLNEVAKYKQKKAMEEKQKKAIESTKNYQEGGDECTNPIKSPMKTNDVIELLEENK